MAVPKRRTSHAKQGHRRSHHHRKPLKNQYCNGCGSPVMSHTLCWNCGYSNAQGRIMVPMGEEQEK